MPRIKDSTRMTVTKVFIHYLHCILAHGRECFVCSAQHPVEALTWIVCFDFHRGKMGRFLYRRQCRTHPWNRKLWSWHSVQGFGKFFRRHLIFINTNSTHSSVWLSIKEIVAVFDQFMSAPSIGVMYTGSLRTSLSSHQVPELEHIALPRQAVNSTARFPSTWAPALPLHNVLLLECEEQWFAGNFKSWISEMFTSLNPDLW